MAGCLPALRRLTGGAGTAGAPPEDVAAAGQTSPTPASPSGADGVESSAPELSAPTATRSASITAAPSASGPAESLACVAELPEDVRIGQTMLVTVGGTDRVRDWLRSGLIAGVLANGSLTVARAAEFRDATEGTRYGALLAADEEGGEVQRYRGVIGYIPSAQRQSWSMAPAQVRDLYHQHGTALRAWGVDMVLAPVVDVGHGPAIGSRAYSDDPGTVAEYGAAAAAGLADAGILPVLKHFPGQGRTTGDPHDGAAIGPAIDALRDVDLVPYRRILESDEVAVLVGHSIVPGWSELPSSQEPETIDGLLRDELGFDGLVVSDALGMAGSGRSQGDALVGFLQAGGDLGIVGPGGSVEGRRAVRAALADGSLTEERVDAAAARVLAAKGVDACAVDSDGAPQVEVSDVPSDEPVVNPTVQ